MNNGWSKFINLVYNKEHPLPSYLTADVLYLRSEGFVTF